MLAAIAALAALAAPPPAPTHWVEDTAAFLSPVGRAALDARLAAYEHETGHQIVVWTGRTTEGVPLADWAVRTFAAWNVGRKGFDDGLVIFVFSDDRAIGIEVGYGLEARVPDATASRVIRDVMSPRLRAGDRDGAVTAGTDAILAAIEGHPWTPSGAAPPAGLSTAAWVAITVGALAVLLLLATHPRLALWLLWAALAGSRRGGGGGRGGGGFGGGGGRSGGGGARGNW